jgi:hypothetical protein
LYHFVCLLEQALRQRESRELLRRQTPRRLDAIALQHGRKLAGMLGRVPRGSLEELVHRLRPVVRRQRLRTGFVGELSPPLLETPGNLIAVPRDFPACGVRAFGRWYVGVLNSVIDAFGCSLQKRFSDTKHMVCEQSYRPIAIRDDPVVDLVVGDLADQSLCCAQHVRPLAHELIRRQRFVPRALQAHELGHVFEVLPEYELLALRNNRHVTHAELEQALPAAGVVQYVDVFEGNALTRKKLFRPQTTASARLREENEFVSDRVHLWILGWCEWEGYSGAA